MEKKQIFKAIEPTGKANAEKDIGLINQYSRKPLTPQEVFVFSIILCDNEVDRDNERFTNATLDALAPLFLGRTGISDHNWSAEKQIARVYRTEVETTNKSNSLGEPLRVLRGDVYMLNNETNKALIEAIDGGIIKEVSVGCSINKCICSICDETFGWLECPNNHRKGQRYDGKLCYGELKDPKDAYEFSFVAVPAQPGAGVTKGAADKKEAERRERAQLIEDLEKQGIKVKAPEESTTEKQTAERMNTMSTSVKKIPAKYCNNYEKPSEDEKNAFYGIVLNGGNPTEALAMSKSLGAIPAQSADLGYGDRLLPSNMSREILTEPSEENSLRLIEPVSQVAGLEEPVLAYQIDELTLADVTDKETVKEIKMSGSSVAYGRFKTKISATIKDTIVHGAGSNLTSAIENALRSGLAVREKMNAFKKVHDGVNEHMSFYLNGIKEVTGPNLIQAIINAWADLPEAFATRACCVMRKTDYFNEIISLANNNNDLWGKKPEDVIGIPVVYNDYAVIPVVGDFTFSRQNYDIAAAFQTDKDARAGDYNFVLTAWGDHRIRLKSAFRLATVSQPG